MRTAATLVLGALAGVAFAHPAPSSIVRLEFGEKSVHAQYWVPVSELAPARAADPDGDLRVYLLRHVAAETAAGVRWRVVVESTRNATYLEHDYIVAELDLAPPPGASSDELVLLDDAVTHEVRNHVVYVVVRHGAESNLVGALQSPARRLDISAPEPAHRGTR